MKPYPLTWPKPDPRRPKAVQTRITDEQKRQLYNRQITTRALAQLLGVHEKYVSSLFPGKAPIPASPDLRAIRNEFREALALEVMRGNLSITQASQKAHTSYNTMQRIFAKARIKYPEMSQKYENILQDIRRNSALKAQKAKNGL